MGLGAAVSDLVERLRSVKEYDDMGLVVRGGKVAEEAANEIERLQKRLALAEAVCEALSEERDRWAKFEASNHALDGLAFADALDRRANALDAWREARGADR